MSSTTETLSDINALLATHSALTSRVRAQQRAHRASIRSLASPPSSLASLPLIPSPSPSPPVSRSPSPPPPIPEWLQKINAEKARERDAKARTNLPPEKRVRLARYANYIPEEETFRNDYCQRYVDSGEWPQNWVLGAELDRRFEEYPKQQRLLHLKRAAVDNFSLPPHYLPLTRLRTMPPSKFDVILLDPPYHSPSFSWDALAKLPVPQLAGDPSFVFMWVGSGAGDGLERGREILSMWGYRRCEDIVWVKTNKACNSGPGTDPPTSSLFTRTKQHCLMGIRGTVRRSTDNWFVHCNIDTDVIIWEGDPEDPTRKPPEMYSLIESFCLGARRLEIFGRRRSHHPLRRGWVTVLLDDDGDMSAADRVEGGVNENEGNEDIDSRASSVNLDEKDGDAEAKVEDEDIKMDDPKEGLEGAIVWNREKWEREVREKCGIGAMGGRVVVPSTNEIDALRPKSPVRGGSSNNNNTGMSGGVSMGMGSSSMHMNHMGGGLPMNMGMSGAVPMGAPLPIPSRPQGQFNMAAMNSTPMMRLGPGVMQNQMAMGGGGLMGGMGGMGIGIGPPMNMGGMGGVNMGGAPMNGMHMGVGGMGMNPAMMGQMGMNPAMMGNMNMGNMGGGMMPGMGSMGFGDQGGYLQGQGGFGPGRGGAQGGGQFGGQGRGGGGGWGGY